MLRQLFLFGFLIICLPGIPQFKKISFTQLNHSWFNCDSYKNIYAISEGKFLKFSPPYTSSLNYNLQKDGVPSFIDINNLNKIVLFFQNSRKVILLDSSFNEIIRPFYLEELGIYDISMIFSSKDGGLWFYNYLNNNLTKLNENLIPVIHSVSLNPFFQPPTSPNFIIWFEDRIFMNIPSNGILVLNQNGKYHTAIQLQGLIDFQVDDNLIYYYRDNIIYCFNIKTLKTNKVYIPYEPNILNAYFYQNHIILLKKDGFTIYQHEINPSENN